MPIRQFHDARSFRARAEPWLLRREAEHNLILGLIPKILAGSGVFEAPIFLSTIERDGEILGCAIRTPPFKLNVTRLPIDEIDGLVEHLESIYPALPAVMGPEREATRFAERWSERTGSRATPGMKQRIHALERVISPESVPGGTLRPAGTADLALLVEWIEAFASDTETSGGDSRTRAEELIRDESIFLWDDGEPRAMAGASGWTPNGVRLGYVYTPPALRGRGYASAATASLSERMLRSGRRSCFLYTDLANPTSNAIYARIGYEPVCDVLDVDFA